MITLKEYEIYLKVKKFIETENCDENDIIPKLINGIGIIPAYVSGGSRPGHRVSATRSKVPNLKENVQKSHFLQGFSGSEPSQHFV